MQNTGKKLAFLFLFVALIPDSFGYVDPGAGHFVWQSLMAAFFGTLFFWRRLVNYLSKKKNSSTEE